MRNYSMTDPPTCLSESITLSVHLRVVSSRNRCIVTTRDGNKCSRRHNVTLLVGRSHQCPKTAICDGSIPYTSTACVHRRHFCLKSQSSSRLLWPGRNRFVRSRLTPLSGDRHRRDSRNAAVARQSDLLLRTVAPNVASIPHHRLESCGRCPAAAVPIDFRRTVFPRRC